MAEEYNIWEMYGLTTNPFNPDPLLVSGGDFPIKDSFFGRQKEFEMVKKIIHSNKTSRILVYGDIGIGKTTFVNFVRFTAIDDKYFTPFGELSIQYNWTAEDFMFYTIDSIYRAVKMLPVVDAKFDKKLGEKLDILFGFKRGHSRQVGGSLAGFGISSGMGESYSPPRLNASTLKEILQEIVNELIRTGYKGVIVHYNNLELVQDKDENQLKKIMNGIRDFLQVIGVHFIFVSDRHLYEMFQQIPRVEDIFKIPILLKSFNFEEINSIIALRIKIATKQKTIPIVLFDTESLKILFKLYNGNLRGILRSLDCAVSEVVKSRPMKIYPPLLKSALYELAKNRFLKDLVGNDKKILLRILEKGETTNKLLSENFKIMPQNVSTSLTKLRDIGAIRLSRAEGRSRYYVPSQEAIWLLLEPKPDIEGQTQLGAH